MWRTGIWRVCAKALNDKSLIEPLESVLYASRYLPQVPFNHLWSAGFSWLEARGEHGAVHTLRTHYFMEGEVGLSAEWNMAITRVAPGTGCGTQPQECQFG